MRTKSDAPARMIQAATELFHAHGIHATSVDDVLRKSSTGKSQFSHYFKNKEGLVHAVLEQLHDVIRNGKAPTGYNVRTWEDLESWFQKYIDFQTAMRCEVSCPVGTIGNDISDETLLRQDIRHFVEWCTSQLARFFAERKASGELPASSDPDALADFCFTVMEGGMLVSKLERKTTTFENAARVALEHVQLLRAAASR